MSRYDLNELNALLEQGAPAPDRTLAPPAWYRAHDGCSGCCPCWARGRSEEKRAQRDREALGRLLEKHEPLPEVTAVRVVVTLCVGVVLLLAVWRGWLP